MTKTFNFPKKKSTLTQAEKAQETIALFIITGVSFSLMIYASVKIVLNVFG